MPAQRHELLQLVLCPSALVVIDFPHPSLSTTVVLGLPIAVMNSGLSQAAQIQSANNSKESKP
jgi:hypothetical protein